MDLCITAPIYLFIIYSTAFICWNSIFTIMVWEAVAMTGNQVCLPISANELAIAGAFSDIISGPNVLEKFVDCPWS